LFIFFYCFCRSFFEQEGSGLETERSITQYVGSRIKFFRKLKDYSLSEFADMIHKSKATMSKYENGQISIDVETLYSIAQALDVDMNQLTDFPVSNREKKLTFNSPFGNRDHVYIYYYDGRKKRIVDSYLCVQSAGGESKTTCMFYMDVASFTNYEKCQFFYIGEMNSFDIVSYLTLANQTNYMEQMGMCILNPLQYNRTTWGFMFGISYNPIAPFALKFLLSLNPLPDTELTVDQLLITKNELKLMKNLNMMLLNPSENENLRK